MASQGVKNVLHSGGVATPFVDVFNAQKPLALVHPGIQKATKRGGQRTQMQGAGGRGGKAANVGRLCRYVQHCLLRWLKVKVHCGQVLGPPVQCLALAAPLPGKAQAALAGTVFGFFYKQFSVGHLLLNQVPG